MAKQNVSLVERHVEKLIVGVAGATLLAVMVFYVILSPHKAELGGEQLGPKKFYAALRERADNTRARMGSAPPDSVGLEAVPDGLFDPPPPAPTRIAVAPVPLNPAVPELEVTQRALRTVKLAEVLAPSKPVVTTGRASARIPEPVEQYVGQAAPLQPEAGFLLPADWHWVTICAAISRKAQREVFQAAGYAPKQRRELVVAEVQAERRQRLPDGQWGPPEVVRPYVPRRVTGPTEVQLFKQEDAYSITADARAVIDSYHRTLGTDVDQAGIVRPAFQEFLAGEGEDPDYRWAWTVPKTLESRDGIEIDLKDEEYGIYFLDEEDSTRLTAGLAGRRPGADAARAGTSGTDAFDAAGMRRVKDNLSKASEAIGKQDYLEADRLLQEVVADPAASELDKANAEKLRKDHRLDIERAQYEQDAKERERQETRATVLGPEAEPLWVNDTTVEPGKTYSYRLRLQAVNPYAGWANDLENPKDAGKVVVDGQWSQWSDPITVKPTKYLFFTSAKEDEKAARVEVYEWSEGDWDNGNTWVKVGQTVAFKKGRTEFNYDALVLDIDFERPYRDRKEGRDGRISYYDKATAALTLVNSRGEVEERIAVADNAAKTELRAEKDKEEKYCKSEGGVGRPGPTIRRGPGPRETFRRPGGEYRGERESYRRPDDYRRRHESRGRDEYRDRDDRLERRRRDERHRTGR